MKNYNFSIIFICTIILSMTMSCDHADIQKAQSPHDEQFQIQTRSDCEECPDLDECCCRIWLDLGDNNASIRLCGTSDGMDACSANAVCGLSTFSGGGQTIDLNSTTNPSQLFCMGNGDPFWIYNYSMMDHAYIIITCQLDHTNPEEIHIHLEPGERFYYETNGSCEINPC